jgi:hypothetical protein
MAERAQAAEALAHALVLRTLEVGCERGIDQGPV